MGAGIGHRTYADGAAMMVFSSMEELLVMGGHGLYVWLAYGATVTVLIGSAITVNNARKRTLAQLRWSLQAGEDSLYERQRSLAETAESPGQHGTRHASSATRRHDEP